MSCRIAIDSSTHAFVACEVIVSIVTLTDIGRLLRRAAMEGQMGDAIQTVKGEQTYPIGPRE